LGEHITKEELVMNEIKPWMERLRNYREFVLMRTAPAVDALYHANFSMEQLRTRAEMPEALEEDGNVEIENNIISISTKGGYTVHVDNSGNILRDSTQARGIFTSHMLQLLDALLVQMNENLRAHVSSQEVTISIDDYLQLRDIKDESKFKHQSKLIRNSLEVLAAISIDFDGRSKRPGNDGTAAFIGMRLLTSNGKIHLKNREIRVEFTEKFMNYMKTRTTLMPYFGFMAQLDISNELAYAFARKLCQQYFNKANRSLGTYCRLRISSLIAVCPVLEGSADKTKDAAKKRKKNIYDRVGDALDSLCGYIVYGLQDGSKEVDLSDSFNWSYKYFCRLKIQFGVEELGSYQTKYKSQKKSAS